MGDSVQPPCPLFLLNVIEEIYLGLKNFGQLPLRGIFQGIKVVGATIALIVAVALLLGKSPMLLFSGLGAMTAVVLLIFKDPILGLIAGIQLSANDMLAVGDWLEMPQNDADGDVIDISLTTVKVCNWDKTITTIPSYALISDSFKNWRNIENVGGRRIKRAINVDATSIKFLDDDDLARLRNAQLLSDYIEDKLKEIESDNSANGVDPSSPVNGRKLTNLGIFRAYLTGISGGEQAHQSRSDLHGTSAGFRAPTAFPWKSTASATIPVGYPMKRFSRTFSIMCSPCSPSSVCARTRPHQAWMSRIWPCIWVAADRQTIRHDRLRYGSSWIAETRFSVTTRVMHVSRLTAATGGLVHRRSVTRRSSPPI
ncbi:MAG: mechanosensitive ion channel family protein [Gammaproteobacteria bacterium]|nr:mechanosensitive ion channel family protein [Gammaproteobacteria bacterium]